LRGAAISLKNSGRSRRRALSPATLARVRNGRGAAVEVMTMSTSPTAPSVSSNGTAVPPSARASSWARAQVRMGVLAHLPGAHEEDGTPRERAQDPLGQLNRLERDGDGMTPDLRLRAHPLGHGEGLAEQALENWSHRLRRLGQRKRVLHLPRICGSPDIIASRLVATRRAWRRASPSTWV
jgi:hypothetical protein